MRKFKEKQNKTKQNMKAILISRTDQLSNNRPGTIQLYDQCPIQNFVVII